jgi:hypothetical protein
MKVVMVMDVLQNRERLESGEMEGRSRRRWYS